MGTTSTDILASVVEVVQEMVDDLELDFDDQLGGDTRLIADLGFASVDFIHLLVALETKFDQKMGFHDLIMPGGKYVSDLTIGQFADFIEMRLAGGEVEVAESPDEAPVAVEIRPKLQIADLDTFISLMPSVEKWGTVAAPAKKNPRAAFVLSSPRSGSTLLRVILAGHPDLFAPPEFHLLYFATLGQRKAALGNKLNEHLLSGTVRAIMHMKNCSVEEAEAFMQACEEQDMSTHDFYGLMIKLLGKKLLIDKTPTYSLHPATLHRAERDFESPLYIHITRHPCGMIKSFSDAQMQQLVPFMRESTFSNHEIAELAWLISNRNIDDFFETLPPERRLRIRFEDLVKQPESSVRQMCEFLQVPFSERMLDPYKEPAARMTDGLHTAAQLGGDLKFYLHNRIEPDTADRWRKTDSEESLSDMSRDLARKFGYL